MTRLVLLHGAGGGPEVWHAVARQLAREGIEVDAPALPGHRDGGAGFDSIAAYADWVAARLDGQAVVCGSSMGGAIALWLALERPELVERLVVVGTSARMRVGQLVYDLVDRYDAEAQAELARLQLAPGADERTVRKSAELIGLVPQAVTRGDFEACDAFDVRERLGEVRAPALAIVRRARSDDAAEARRPARRGHPRRRARDGARLGAPADGRAAARRHARRCRLPRLRTGSFARSVVSQRFASVASTPDSACCASAASTSGVSALPFGSTTP